MGSSEIAFGLVPEIRHMAKSRGTYSQVTVRLRFVSLQVVSSVRPQRAYSVQMKRSVGQERTALLPSHSRWRDLVPLAPATTTIYS